MSSRSCVLYKAATRRRRLGNRSYHQDFVLSTKQEDKKSRFLGCQDMCARDDIEKV